MSAIDSSGGKTIKTVVITVGTGVETTATSSPVQTHVAQNQQAPTANAGPDKTMRLNEQLKLDGNQSSDPEGYRLHFFWEKISGPDADLIYPSTSTPTFTPSTIGEYVIKLTVTDLLQKTASDNVEITVLDEDRPLQSPVIVSEQNQTGSVDILIFNKPPIIKLKESAEASIGDEITIDSLAVDPEGGEITYNWQQIGGEPVIIVNLTQPTLKFTSAKSGLYTFELTVTDKDGKTSTKRITVKLVENAKPLQGEQNILLWIIIGVVIIVTVIGLVFWKIKPKK